MSKYEKRNNRLGDNEQPQDGDNSAKRSAAIESNTYQSVLAEVERMIMNRGSMGLPDAIPRTVHAAAEWIVGRLFDPRDKGPDGKGDFEAVQQIPAFGGHRFTTPYRDRIIYLTKKFLSLPPIDQDKVCDCENRMVKWRGDDMYSWALLMSDNPQPSRSMGKGHASMVERGSRGLMSVEDLMPMFRPG